MSEPKHPADMTAEEFFALPVIEWPESMGKLQPLRSRHDKLGWSRDGVWWLYVYADDGSWARRRA